MKHKGYLMLTEDLILDEHLIVEGNIICKEGLWNIEARNIEAWNIEARNIEALDIKARNIEARNIEAWNIEAWNIEAGDIQAEDIKAGDIQAEDIQAEDISYYAFCIAYNSLKCKSINGRRENSIHKCLDKDIEYTKNEDSEEIIELNGKKYKLIDSKLK